MHFSSWCGFSLSLSVIKSCESVRVQGTCGTEGGHGSVLSGATSEGAAAHAGALFPGLRPGLGLWCRDPVLRCTVCHLSVLRVRDRDAGVVPRWFICTCINTLWTALSPDSFKHFLQVLLISTSTAVHE